MSLPFPAFFHGDDKHQNGGYDKNRAHGGHGQPTQQDAAQPQHRPRAEVCGQGHVRLIFANPRDQADQEIIDMVHGSRQPGSITVVTNDKFILREIKSAGGKSQGCGPFLKRIRRSVRRANDPLRGEDPRKYHGISAREVDEWMEIFGFQDE